MNTQPRRHPLHIVVFACAGGRGEIGVEVEALDAAQAKKVAKSPPGAGKFMRVEAVPESERRPSARRVRPKVKAAALMGPPISGAKAKRRKGKRRAPVAGGAPKKSSKARAPKSSKARAPTRAPKSSKARAPKSSKARAPKSGKARAPKSGKARAPKSSKARAPKSSKSARPPATTVQTLLFPKASFTDESARAWLSANHFRSDLLQPNKPEDRYLHFRQQDPKPGAKYRTIAFDRGPQPAISAVVEVKRRGKAEPSARQVVAAGPPTPPKKRGRKPKHAGVPAPKSGRTRTAEGSGPATQRAPGVVDDAAVLAGMRAAPDMDEATFKYLKGIWENGGREATAAWMGSHPGMFATPVHAFTDWVTNHKDRAKAMGG